MSTFAVRAYPMHWSDVPLHFIDFEGNLTSGILEYGIVTLRGSKIDSVETNLCRPVGHIRSSDTAVHGLSEADLVGRSQFSESFAQFATLRASGPLGAHFAQAENSLIRGVWPYPRTSPDFSRPGQSITDWGPWIDTGRLYAQLFPKLPSGKLGDLIELFQLAPQLAEVSERYCPPSRRHYHAALFDTLAAVLLFLDLTRRPEFAEATIPWLLQMSTANPVVRANLQQRDLF